MRWHTSFPKRVVFGPNIGDISNISTWNLIAKGVANHGSKAYEFLHFFPYSHQSVQFNKDPLQDLQPVEKEGKSILPTPFTHYNVSSDDTDSKVEDEDEV